MMQASLIITKFTYLLKNAIKTVLSFNRSFYVMTFDNLSNLPTL